MTFRSGGGKHNRTSTHYTTPRVFLQPSPSLHFSRGASACLQTPQRCPWGPGRPRKGQRLPLRGFRRHQPRSRGTGKLSPAPPRRVGVVLSKLWDPLFFQESCLPDRKFLFFPSYLLMSMATASLNASLLSWHTRIQGIPSKPRDIHLENPLPPGWNPRRLLHPFASIFIGEIFHGHALLFLLRPAHHFHCFLYHRALI